MRSFLAFLKKEFLGQLRTGKIWILGSLFAVFGIMNPAVAKLTPWLLEMLSDSLAETGMNITVTAVSAMDSWVQFFKNIPMALIAFAVLEGGIFTREYSKGTLILSLTKGLARWKVVISKAVTLAVIWSAGYWLCFGITYGANTWFWDNSVAKNLGLSAACWWLFGMWVIGGMVLFSVLFRNMAGTLLGTGGVVMALAMAGLLPKVGKYLPTMLMDGNSLIYGLAEGEQYLPAIVIAGASLAAAVAVSIPVFNKKAL